MEIPYKPYRARRGARVVARCMACVLGVVLLCASAPAAIAQSGRITVKFDNIPLKSAIAELQKKSGYNFLYNNSLINGELRVSANLANATLDAILKKILAGTNIRYAIENRQVVLFPVEQGAAPAGATPADKAPARNPASEPRTSGPSPEITVSGTVRDSEQALPGAVVAVKGRPESSVATDGQGAFSISGVAPNAVLRVSYLGYKTAEVAVAGRQTLTVVLEPDTKTLADVVVTGYQTISRERSAGSYSVITGDDMKGKLQTDVLSRMEGMTPGMTSYKGDVRIRGTATLSVEAVSPLYVLDGAQVSKSTIDRLNPSEIANITVLKDATAASIYGAQSTNGVVVVTTRGGQANKTSVEYSGAWLITPLTDDRDYLGLMNSAELVAWQREMFNAYHTPYSNIAEETRLYLNPVSETLYAHSEGRITQGDLEAVLKKYGGLDNRPQLVDNFLRKASVTQQHNVSLRGGVDKYRYALSVNYMQNSPYEKSQSDERWGFNMKTNYDFYKWLKAEVGVIGSFSEADFDNGFTARNCLYGGFPSWQMLFDEQGRQLDWYPLRSQRDIDRLVALGLYDESYFPLNELHQSHYKSTSAHLNLNVGLNVTFTRWMTGNVRYQTERSAGYQSSLLRAGSYTVRTVLNNSSVVGEGGKQNETNMPEGAHIAESRSENNNYILRAQLNFNHRWGSQHEITGIAGAERRSNRFASTGIDRWGFDEVSLAYKYLNEMLLIDGIQSTEEVNTGSFYYTSPQGLIKESENRYVGFYANGAYTFRGRYIVNASARTDQSNIFGSEPRYRYRPMWSVGLSWRVTDEPFMDVAWLDYLALRVTNGTNGNSIKGGGPYLVAIYNDINPWTQDYGYRIRQTPNPGLRWERTFQSNVGVDFRVLDDRLGGSVEFYTKNTSDVLGSVEVDATLTGRPTEYLNYAKMYNRGVEIGLDSRNITGETFNWETTLNLSYNKNRITKLFVTGTDVNSYIGKPNNRVGQPMGTLYSFRWASLDRYGKPQAYKKDGTVARDTYQLAVEDLVNNGTAVPPYSASLSNRISYKGLELSFMFIYYGGHVMRTAMPAYITHPEYYNDYSGGFVSERRDITNYWRSAADTNDPSKSPGINPSAPDNVTQLWYAADRHIRKADYIKLRDVSLSYTVPARLISKARISNLMLIFQATNLWYWAANDEGLDPEIWSGTDLNTSRGMPIPPTFSFGLNLSF